MTAFKAMGITGRANLERQKSTRLGRSPGAIVRVRFGAIPLKKSGLK
jgi:hypothetical protein